MLGTTDAAAATMPGHGRAYILVGTGSRYEYFQSAYTGANKNTDIKPAICGFGPPLSFTTTSTWTWIDHPVSGLRTLTLRPVKTWYPFGSAP